MQDSNNQRRIEIFQNIYKDFNDCLWNGNIASQGWAYRPMAILSNMFIIIIPNYLRKIGSLFFRTDFLKEPEIQQLKCYTFTMDRFGSTGMMNFSKVLLKFVIYVLIYKNTGSEGA